MTVRGALAVPMALIVLFPALARGQDPGRLLVVNKAGASVSVVDLAEGREVWVTNRAENTVSVVDARSLEVIATLPSTDFPIRVVFTPDGARAMVTNARSAELRVFDASARRDLMAIPIQAPVIEGRAQVIAFEGSPSPIGLLAHRDGRHVYVAAASADAVAVVDLEAGAVVELIAVGREPDGLAWAPGVGG